MDVQYKVKLFYLTKKVKAYHVNLLVLKSKNSNHHHYCLIKHLSRLMSKQLSLLGHATFVCNSCLIPFPSDVNRRAYISNEECFGKQVILPFNHLYLEFEHYERKVTLKFAIYAGWKKRTC